MSKSEEMNGISDRIANLSPEQHMLLALRLRSRKQQAGYPKIPVAPERRSHSEFPLSYAQERLWFLEQLEPENIAYNIPAAYSFTGALNIVSLEQTLNEVVRRHEVLRTTFIILNGQPRQVISPHRHVGLRIVDLTSLPAARREFEIKKLAIEESHLPFDLTTGPLIRATLIYLGPRNCVLIYTLHHIISDGWSTGVLIRDVETFYNSFLKGEVPSLPDLTIQYLDFAVWQRKWLQGKTLESQLSYWKRRLEGQIPTLDLPTDHPRPTVQSFRGAAEPFAISQAKSEAIRVLSHQTGVSLFMMLLATFKILLYRYTGQEDLVVGAPIANRNLRETEGLIGFFVNTLALRSNLSGDPTFRNLLLRVRQVALDAFTHQDLPLEKLVEVLRPGRDMSRSPLFQVLFSLQNAPRKALEVSDLAIDLVNIDWGTAKFDLTMFINDGDREMTGTIEYNRDLFERSTILRAILHFQTLLDSVLANPDEVVSDLSIMTIAERQQLLTDWNNTEAPYGESKRIHEYFESQVKRTPDAIALVFEDRQLTYLELNRRANQLARCLWNLGARPEALVGICMERSLEMVIGLLGILKSGGAYVPLDPEYPQERLAFLLDDIQPSALVTQEHLIEKTSGHNAPMIRLDTEGNALNRYDGQNLDVGVRDENLAYVIYTSGSTGKPKGVMNAHRGVINRLLWMQSVYHFNNYESVLQKTPFTFDVSVWEFFGPLMFGARLILAAPGGHRDASYLVNLIREQNITTLHFVPSMLQVFLEEPHLDQCGSILRVCCSGEALSLTHQERFWGRMKAELHNNYGPTEASVDVTFWRCERERAQRSVPIGRPIANTQLYVLDKRMSPVPVGVTGELYIAGVNLARGYHNRSDLAAERFIPNSLGPLEGERMYRTGDLVRYRSDGVIEYIGRTDHQVKLRGFRVELGEVEEVLKAHHAVKEAVVIAVDSKAGDKRLVGYVELREAVREEELRAYVKGKVPEYMAPFRYEVVERFPATSSGKVDRKRLAERAAGKVEEDKPDLEPRNETEEIVAGIWAEVLGVGRVGIHDNFFDLGGHSLLATQVVSRVREIFHVEFALRDFFQAPLIIEIVKKIDQLRRGDHQESLPILPAPRGEQMPLSFAQRRMWIVNELDPNSSAYNIPFAIRISGTLNIAALQDSINEVIRRHEILRTTFRLSGDEPEQIISSVLCLNMPFVDLRGLGLHHRTQQTARLARESSRQVFNLIHGPLLSVTLLQCEEQEYILLLSMHHIVCDGWAIGILFREIGQLYGVFSTGAPSPLAELPIQYSDFAAWQRQRFDDDVLEEKLGYLRKQLTGITKLKLPADRPSPAIPTFRGAAHPFMLPHTLSIQLKQLSRRFGATLYMTLLAAFKVLLQWYCRQDYIAVGTDIANRNRAETEGLIGFFVNQLVLCTDLSGNPTFGETLGRVREVTLEAYANQDLPFDKLVELMNPERTNNHSPLFNVKFVLHNVPGAVVDVTGIRLHLLEQSHETTELDLQLNITDSEEGLRGYLEYSADLFEPATAAQIVENYSSVLKYVVEHSTATLGSIRSMLDGVSRQQMNIKEQQFQKSRLNRLKDMKERNALKRKNAGE